MPDAFDVLCDRVRTLREGWGDVERASLVFVAGGGIGERGLCRVRVRVDGRPAVGVGPKGVTVAVVPGVHRIRARFSAWDGLETGTVMRSVEAGPGDRVVLVCGIDGEAARALADLGARVMRRFLFWSLGSMAAMAAGWLLFPILHEMVAGLAISLRLHGLALRLAYLPVRSRTWIATFLAASGQILLCILALRSHRVVRELRARYPSPFFVGPKDKRALADDEFGS